MTEDNVVPFGKPEEKKADGVYDAESVVWVCACGCRSFYLEQSGTFQCTACLHRTNGDPESIPYGWAKFMPQVSKAEEAPDYVVHHHDTVDFARNGVLRTISNLAKAGKLDYVFGVGLAEMNTWCNGTTRADHEYVSQCLRSALARSEAREKETEE